MSIANSVIEAARAESSRYPRSRVRKISLRIGEWSGVDTESLRFCFDVLKTETEMADAELEIEYRERSDDLLVSSLELECPEDPPA